MSQEKADNAYRVVDVMKQLLQGHIKGVELPEEAYHQLAEAAGVPVGELAQSLDTALQMVGSRL
jgi:hypothetical protein